MSDDEENFKGHYFVVCGWMDGTKARFEIDDDSTAARFHDGAVYRENDETWYYPDGSEADPEDQKNDSLLYETLKRKIGDERE